jgi:UPF0755 protein
MHNFSSKQNYRINKSNQQPKSRKTKVYFIAFILLIIFLHLHKNLWRKSSSELITLEIPEGTGISQTAEILESEGVISNKTLFKLKAKAGTPIQAGTFNIPRKANINSILEIIQKPPQTKKITIPEGFTIKQIDERLAANGLINPGEFINCTQTCPIPEDFAYRELIEKAPNRNLEGLLFPNTYFLSDKDFTPENFFNKLLTDFGQKISNLLAESPQNDRDLYDIIIMASILEKEVRGLDDSQIVSGLLWKRLDNDWTLGADATLLYEKNNREITRTDLDSDSAYNTRKFKGLPPTPINNPGEISLKAALNPVESRYWFYLTPASGEVIYAETNDEHNANKAKYL